MDKIEFTVNGTKCAVGNEVTSETTVLDYIRNNLQLRGTKYNCREGGCGACIVTASMHPGAPSIAVNSCLVSIMQCHNWEITTIEGLGNIKDGYHVLQTTLAKGHGTQCGYCSPGFVMNMHGLLEQNPKATMLDIELGFGSNICRCTGYRPILESFKKCASDAPKDTQLLDIEDLYICKKSGKICNKNKCDEDDWCIIDAADVVADKMKKIDLKDGKTYYIPTTLSEVSDILRNKIPKDQTYMLIGGNTAKGAYPIDEYPPILLDISAVAELKEYKLEQNLVVGAATTLAEFTDKANATASEDQGFSYLLKIRDHVLQVAHNPVRNVGTIGGNLMIKHSHNEFPSDIFLLLETVGADMTVVDTLNNKSLVVTMQQFLQLDMNRKVIRDILFPPLSEAEYKLVTYKIMPRAQSAHAMINAGFLYKMSEDQAVQSCRIVYGNLSPKFIRASATEAYLVGKKIFTNETLQGALKVLDGELIVEPRPPEPSVEYRRHVAKGLFYKGLLSLCPTTMKLGRYGSGATKLHASQQVSDGRQIFTTDPTKWPLNKPIEKLEALIQTAGEAQYVEDIPSYHNEVFAAFVLSTAVGIIVSEDDSEAKKDKDYICYMNRTNLHLNSFTPADNKPLYTANEEVFCDGKSMYFNQPVGIVVAKTYHAAIRASKLIKIQYSNTKVPVIDIKEARKDSSRNTLVTTIPASLPGLDVKKTIKGSTAMYGQCHFTMETIACVARPTDQGIEVHSTTQWLDGVQTTVARALNMGLNEIDAYVTRIGGGYGLKISRSNQCAIACCLAVKLLRRPCRLIMPLTDVFRAVGKRLPCVNDFEVKVNSKGVIQLLNTTVYEDNGYKINETLSALGAGVYNNCYDSTKWNFKLYDTITDTTKNTWCRSPGTLEVIACAETIMEQISYGMGLDPLEVRLANIDKVRYNDVVQMVDMLKTKADYTARRAAVDKFNTENRWKKRGMRCSMSRWAPTGALILNVTMSVYHSDGTINIVHSGVEMGQGINTKAAQMAAYWLKVPIEKIKIKGNNTIISPNSFISGGSLTTQSVCIGLKRCCDQLLARLAPIRLTLINPTWFELVNAAYTANINLQAHGYTSYLDVQMYDIFGIGCCEVEFDVLTGETKLLRVDMVQDVGFSISPEIDIGQVEGALMMGFGYWTTERLEYKETGELLTNRTWDYHVPQARDLPLDWRVYFKPNTYSNELILSSKATGEPAICTSIMLPFAIRECVSKAREESGIPSTTWFPIDGPHTCEKTCLAAKTNTEDFKFTDTV